jgi:hypothetical protein
MPKVPARMINSCRKTSKERNFQSAWLKDSATVRLISGWGGGMNKKIEKMMKAKAAIIPIISFVSILSSSG